MSGSDQHIHYSAADIEKYLKGELSAPAMHALEKAALEDPFLADALEGMAIHQSMPGAPALQQEFHELEERLGRRVAAGEKAVPAGKSLRPLFLRYAAALILLAGLGTAFYYTFSSHQRAGKDSLAQEVSRPAPAETKKADQDSASTAVAAASTPPPAAEDQEKSEAPAVEKREQAEAAKKETIAPAVAENAAGPMRQAAADQQDQNTVARVRQVAAADQQYRVDTSLLKKMNDTVDALKMVAIKGRYSNNYISSSHFGDSTQKYAFAKTAAASQAQYFIKDDLVFTGKVTDPNNNALQGAALLLKGNTRINAVTDKNGYFSLRVPRKDSVGRVLVQYVGFQVGDVALSLENLRGNVIQLQPQSTALNEVVISGYGSKRKEIIHRNIDTPTDPLSLVAVPAGGWPAYNEYLAFSKQLAGVDTTIKGNESISFLVDKKGRLSSFKVEQSLSPAHDSACIHIIKEGPAWQLLNSSKKARARVIIAW